MRRAKVTGTIWPAGLYTYHGLPSVKASAMGGTSTQRLLGVRVAEEGGAGTEEGGAGTRTEALFLGLRLPQRAFWLTARVQGIG